MASSQPEKRSGASGPSGRAAIAPDQALKEAFTRDRHFLTCVVALLLGLGGVQWLTMRGFRFSKERVDLKAPLSNLNPKLIVPYRLVGSDRIPKEEVEALGTEEYIRWRLEDTSIANRNDPLRWPSLFVTYYSGQPDQVPHVPEECLLGGGYQQLESRASSIKAPGVLPGVDDVPVRIATFRKDSMIGGAWVPTVIYTFLVNGEFVGTRTGVRLALSNPFEQYGYFSKVEVCFGRRGGPGDAELVRKAAERFLAKILPVLISDHWPDWPVEDATEDG